MLQSGFAPLFPVKGIWVSFVPTKVSFFAWEAAWGKVLTMDKLQRRGWNLPNRCFLCDHAKGTILHLLLHCPMVSPLWEIVFSLVGISWVFPKMVKEAIIRWKGSFLGKKLRKFLKSVPLCIFWTI